MSDSDASLKPFTIQSGAHTIVQLDRSTVPPLGGIGRLIAPGTILAPNEEVSELSSSTDADGSPVFGDAFDNSTIFFPLVPDTSGASTVDNDDNWGFGEDGVGADQFLSGGIEGQGVRIGIADSGMDSTLPMFGRLIAQRRLVGFAHFDKLGRKVVQHRPDGSALPDAEAVPTFGHWHGTHCAGILVGEATEGKVHGVAPRAELAVVRVLEQGNEGSVAGILAGLWWLSTQQCDVVSLSLGRPGLEEVWWPPISAMLDAGIVVVAAVGNEALTPASFLSRSPANYLPSENAPEKGRLIPVGAHDQLGAVWDESSGEVADWSNVQVPQIGGTTRPSVFASTRPRIVPTLVAPGVDIISGSPPGSKFRSSSGSSMATPHIAGLVALVLSKLRIDDPSAAPNVAADFVLSCLADIPPDGPDTRSGNGRVDNQALRAKLNLTNV